MSLVDYASSSDDDVKEPTEQERKEEQKPHLSQNDAPAAPPPQHNPNKSGSTSDQQPEKFSHSSSPLVEKLPDASLLLNSPAASTSLMNASDHSSRVAAALAENASRKRDSNGMASSAVRSKVPRGNLVHTRNVPDTSSGMLVPPQISGRKNVVTEDLNKLFVKKHG